MINKSRSIIKSNTVPTLHGFGQSTDLGALDTQSESDTKLSCEICHVYEEVMWLARRGAHGVTAAAARGWGVGRCDRLKRRLRRFTGYLSEAAISAPINELHLDHPNRIHKQITELVMRHLKEGDDPEEFIQMIFKLEYVNIVTGEENRHLRHKNGDYTIAGIKLKNWNDVPLDRKKCIYDKKIKNNVLNYREFTP